MGINGLLGSLNSDILIGSGMILLALAYSIPYFKSWYFSLKYFFSWILATKPEIISDSLSYLLPSLFETSSNFKFQIKPVNIEPSNNYSEVEFRPKVDFVPPAFSYTALADNQQRKQKDWLKPLVFFGSFQFNSKNRLRLGFAISIILILSFGLNYILINYLPKNTAKANGIPGVTANIPAAVTIGSNFNFTLSVTNTGSSEGYSPFVDLIVPTIGADGAGLANEDDGITVNSASYLGQSLSLTSLVFPETGVGCSGGLTPVSHPLAVTNTGQKVTVCGTPGNTLVVVSLPFGSFVPEQSPSDIDFTASLSPKADNNFALSMQYRAGFRFGNDSLNNYTTDPTILSSFGSSSVTPVLFSVTKTYNGPESETATGLNYKRRYTVSADLAPGQSVTNLDLIDKLPNNLAYFQLISSSPSGATIQQTPTVGQAANSPNNVLRVRFPSVTGSASSSDAQMVFEYFVPDKNASGSDIINHTNGDDVIAQDDASGQAVWTPLDTRDAQITITSDLTPVDHTLNLKSVAIQKSFQNLTNANNRPGDSIQYTLNFQISDYFAFQNLTSNDILSDGQSFDNTFTPTLSVNESGVTTTGNIHSGNYNFSRNTGFSGATGQTTVNFNISNELVSRGQDAKVLGGCVQNSNVSNCTNNLGAATGTLVFRAKIDDVYTDSYGSGDPSLDMGDSLSDNVTINGDVLNNTTLLPSGQSEADTSSAQFTIVTGSLQKTIYALNGVIGTPNPANIGPGDTITYRLTYDLTLTDTENFYIDDYLPLPTFRANGFSTAFNSTISSSIPAAGTAKFGPNETFKTISGLTPAVTVDNTQNKIRFNYGAFQDPMNRSAIADILFTVTANNEPFADGVNLVNQARARATNTFNTEQVANAVVPVTILMPDVTMKKGVVSTNNASAVFTPATVAPVSFNAPGSTTCNLSNHRFSSTINSTNLTTSPIDSNVSNVDGSDLVTFALTFENKGKSPRGAFDLKIKDDLPTGFSVPAGGINLCITRGNGTPLNYIPVNNSDSNPLLGSGIEISDISASQGAIGTYDAINGANIVIATYDLKVSPTIQPKTNILNTANFFNYTGADGGTANFVPNNSQSDTATTSTSDVNMSKTLVSTNQADSAGNNVMVGEILNYQVVATIPEGQTQQAKIVDSLDSGLSLVSIDSITPSSNLTTSLSGGFAAVASNAAVTGSGQNIALDFGTLTNSDTSNTTFETITINYKVVVLNTSAVNRGTQLNNSAIFSYNNGSSQTLSPVFAPNVTVIEPEVQAVKTVNNSSGDANDLLTYTLTVSHTANSNANSYDLNLSDVIPSSLVYEAGTLNNASGVAPTSLNITGNTVTATYTQLNLGQTSVIQFQARPVATVYPGQVITNSATVTYTSLPGNVTTAQSSYNPNSTERTGNTANPGGSSNDLTYTGSNNFTVNNVAEAKTVVSTSEAHTTNVAGVDRLAIGEIVRYRLATQIPEGEIINFRVRDNLPAGLQFLNDNTAKVGFSSNGNVTSSISAFGSCNQVGSSATISAGCNIPGAQISGGPFDDGTDPTFALGTIENTDNDANAEYAVIEFNALVLNVASNQAFNQSTGASVTTTLSNNYTAIRQDSLGADVNMLTSGNRSSQVAEPLIRNLTKTITQMPVDSGDPLTYRLTFGNTASGNNAANAYEVRLFDTLNANLQLNSINIVSKPSTTTVTNNSNLGANSLDLIFDKLGPTESVTVDITASVLSTVSAGQNIGNTAQLTYTSLPGSGTTANSTGSNIPNSSATTSERTGSASPSQNDFNNSGSANFNVTTGSINKTNTAGATFRIGDEQEFDLTATVAEGLNKNLRVRDNLPSGLEYVSYQVISTASGTNGILSEDFSSSLPTPAVSGSTAVTFNFGDVTLPSDNDTNNNSFIVRVKTRVKDVAGNQNSTVLTNNADLITTNVASSADQVVPDPTPPTITLAVPILSVVKTFSPASGAPNDNVTVQIQLTNSGNAVAYDTNLSDTIQNSELASPVLLTTPSGFTGSITPSGSTNIIDYTGGDVLAGQTLTFTFRATLPSNLTFGHVISNTATVTAASTLPGVSSFERVFSGINGSANLTVQTPDLQVTKTDSTSVRAPGNNAVYVVTVTNNGTYKADNIALTENLPQYSSFNSSFSSGSTWTNTTGSIYNALIPTLNPGQSISKTFAVTIDSTIPSGVSQLVNITSVVDDGTHGADPTPSNNTFTDTDSLNAAPDIEITKTDGVGFTQPGDTLTYILTIKNTGNQDAVGVVVTDTLPTNTAYQSSTNSGANSSGVVNWPSFSLPAGQTVTRTVVVAVNSTAPSGVTQITNIATANDDGTNGTDPTPANNIATDTDSLNAAPDLVITKTDGVSSAEPDNTLTYTLTITNNGNQDAVGVTVTDTLPANTAYQSSSNGGSLSGNTLTFPTFNLPANQSVNRIVTVKVNSTIPAGVLQITNTATANDDSSNGPDPYTSNNIATDTDSLDAQPDLAITKTNSQTSVAPDQTLAYDIALTNNGNQTATGVIVMEHVPANSNFVTSGSSSWSCNDGDPAGTICTHTTASLAAGVTQNLVFKIVVQSVIPAGITSFSNTISTSDDSTNGPDPTPADNTFTDTDALNAAPDLVVTKTDGVSSAAPDDILTYTINIQNAGNQDAVGVIVTDTLPANTIYQYSSDSGTQNGGILSWPLFNLAAGQSTTRSVVVKVNSTVPSGVSQLINTVVVNDDGTNGTDPTPSNNTFTDTDTLNAAPDLAINITDSGASSTTGSVVTYAVNYINTGVQDATGVIVSVIVPQNTTFNLAGSSSGWSCSNSAVAGTICTKNIGNLNVGDTGSLNFAVKVNDIVPAGVENIQVSSAIADDGTNGSETTILNNSSTDSTPLAATPDLKITIDDLLATVNPDQTITYGLKIENIGDQTATGIDISSELPANTAYISSSNGGVYGSGNVTWSLLSLNAGDSVIRTFTIKINQTIPSGVNTISSVATVADDGTNGTDPTPLNNTDTDTDTLDAFPDLVISKTDNGATATPGTDISYNLNYANNGNQNATGVVITETVPANTIYVATGSSNWSCSNGDIAGTSCTLNIGSLNSGDSGTKVFKVAINNPLPSGVDTINNIVGIDDNGINGPDPTPLNNTDTEITTSDALPDLVIAKTDNGVSKQPGEDLVYNITYSNDGNQNATGVVITETVPANTIYVATGSSNWSCSNGDIAGTSCTLNIGSLNSGDSGTKVFKVKVVNSLASGVTQTVNTISIQDDGANGTDPAPSDNQSTETTPLVAAPDLVITKSDSLTNITRGQSFVYTLTASNTGNQDATGVVIYDTLPDYLTVNTISNGGIQSGNLITWPAISLAVGANTTRTVNVTFDPGATVLAGLEQITNTAQVLDDGSNGSDLNGANNTATDTDNVNALPDLVVSIDDGQTTVNTGQQVNYTIVAQNVGNQDASNSVLTVNLPDGLVYSPSGSTAGWICNLTLCTFNLNTMTAGTTRNIILSLNVASPSIVDTILVPVQIADDGQGGADPTPLNNSAQDQDNIVGLPNLVVTKTDGITTLSAGQESEYTINIKNNGNILLTNIQTVDTYQDEFTFVSASTGAVNNSVNHTITWSGLQLLPGASSVYTVRFKLKDVIPSGVENALNSVIVADDHTHGVEQTPSDNTAEDTDIVDAAPDLTLTEQLQTTSLFPGQTLFYKLNYSNIGTQNAAGTKIEFKVPKNTTYVDTPGWTCADVVAGSVCTYVIGNMPVGTIGSVTVQVKIIDNVNADDRDVSNTTTISDNHLNGPEINLLNNDDSSSVLMPKVELELHKTVNKTSARLQDTLTYAFIYRNHGPDTATGIQLEDTLPADLQYISASQDGLPVPTVATILPDGRTKLVFSPPDLSPGVETRILVDTKIIHASNGPLTNSATIRAREVDPDLYNNHSSVDVNILTSNGSATSNNIASLRTGGLNLLNLTLVGVMLILGFGFAGNTFSREQRKKTKKVRVRK